MQKKEQLISDDESEEEDIYQSMNMFDVITTLNTRDSEMSDSDQAFQNKRLSNLQNIQNPKTPANIKNEYSVN